MSHSTEDDTSGGATNVGFGPCLTAPLTVAELDEEAVRAAIRGAFAEQRAFPFTPRPEWAAADSRERRRLAAAARHAAVVAAAQESAATGERLRRDERLMQRLGTAIRLLHEALALAGGATREALAGRRIVLIRERPGATCLYEAEAAAVVARVGPGPIGARAPSIYLGLRLFDVLAAEQRSGGGALPAALLLVLRLEERAIETGYSHLETLEAPQRATLEALFRAVREPTPGLAPTEREPPPRTPVRVSAARRQTLLGQLNARRADAPLDFDEAVCVSAMRRIERLAQHAKAYGDETARREVMRLLVAASGHDLHEVRNHANLLLERMLAPKEFNAPLARTFRTLVRGTAHRFSFELPARRGSYRLRIYHGHRLDRYPGETDLDYTELDLTRHASGAPLVAEYRFEELGHYDFCVTRELPAGAANG